MTNTISASLGLSVLAFLMLDYGIANSDNTLVVAQKFILLLEEIAIWRQPIARPLWWHHILSTISAEPLLDLDFYL